MRRRKFAGELHSRSTKLIELITTAQYDLEENIQWDSVSEEAKDLIRKLLELDPHKRASARQALQHPWFVCQE